MYLVLTLLAYAESCSCKGRNLIDDELEMPELVKSSDIPDILK